MIGLKVVLRMPLKLLPLTAIRIIFLGSTDWRWLHYIVVEWTIGWIILPITVTIQFVSNTIIMHWTMCDDRLKFTMSCASQEDAISIGWISIIVTIYAGMNYMAVISLSWNHCPKKKRRSEIETDHLESSSYTTFENHMEISKCQSPLKAFKWITISTY